MGIVQEIMEDDDPVAFESSLTSEVGMQSIDFVELSVAIEKELGVLVPFDEFVGNPTINSLYCFINKTEQSNSK